jgi:hypothetical protein
MVYKSRAPDEKIRIVLESLNTNMSVACLLAYMVKAQGNSRVQRFSHTLEVKDLDRKGFEPLTSREI